MRGSVRRFARVCAVMYGYAWVCVSVCGCTSADFNTYPVRIFFYLAAKTILVWKSIAYVDPTHNILPTIIVSHPPLE